MDTKKLRQKILDLAIHGKLVPQDPNDEPASVLLDRIRAEKEQLIKEGKIKAPKKSKSASDTSHYPKEVPFAVPKGWVWCRLESICTKIVDGDHNPPVPEKTPTDYLMLSSKNIVDGQLGNLSEVRYLSKEAYIICNQRTDVQPGDLLLTTVGTLGRSCIYRGGYRLTFQRSVSVISTLIYEDYLKSFFDSGYFQTFIEDHARGTAQKGFYLNMLESTMIPIPPLEEQSRIVNQASKYLNTLSSLDDAASQVKDAIYKCKSKILDLAIHGKLVPQDPSDEPAIELLKRINPDFKPSDNLHYGDVPPGWCLSTLGMISNYGQCDSVSVDEINDSDWVLELEDIEKGSGKLLNRISKRERTPNGIRHRFQEGQVLYSKLRTYLNKVLIADKSGFCTTEIIPMTPIEGLLPEYLNIYLRSPYFLDYSNSCGYGVKMPRLGTQEARKAIIPIPPLNEQRRIIEAVLTLQSSFKDINDFT